MEHKDFDDPHLAACLAALRSDLAGLNSPPGVEKELMQAFAQQFAPRRRWYHKLSTPRWSIPASLASALLVVLVFALAPQAPRLRDGQASTLVQLDGGGAFIALESLERIELEPTPRLVEAEVPRTALAALGLPLTPENASEPVKAEMLVAADGAPLALRLSSIN